MRDITNVVWLTALVIIWGGASLGRAQIPDKFQNLEYFRKDISRQELVQRMREFSFALGVRCQYCHAGGDGVSFEGVKFDSDEKVAKKKARFMLKMVDELNGRVLAGVPSRLDPAVRVDCVTCHRGSAVPRTLEDELSRIITTDGADAAAAKYRELRRDTIILGKYNFSEWTINELAARLARQGNHDAAITMLLLNSEFYPKSADIDFGLGTNYLAKGDKERAIASFRATLEKRPEHQAAKERLAQLLKP